MYGITLVLFCIHSNHLKKGGFLIVPDCLGKPNYKVGHHIFRAAMMRSGDVREIFLQTRFEILEWVEAPFKEDNLRFRCFCILAKRII